MVGDRASLPVPTNCRESPHWILGKVLRTVALGPAGPGGQWLGPAGPRGQWLRPAGPRGQWLAPTLGLCCREESSSDQPSSSPQPAPSPSPASARWDPTEAVEAGWAAVSGGSTRTTRGGDGARTASTGLLRLDRRPPKRRSGGLTGDRGTAVAGSTESGRGKRCGDRGPEGGGGTSPKRSASSGLRPAACPASNAAWASSARMIRTPSACWRCETDSSRSWISSTTPPLGRVPPGSAPMSPARGRGLPTCEQNTRSTA